MLPEIVTTPNAVKEFTGPCIFYITDQMNEVLFVGRSRGGKFNPYQLPNRLNWLDGVKIHIQPFASFAEVERELPLFKLRYNPKYNRQTGQKAQTKTHVGRLSTMPPECYDCPTFGKGCGDCSLFQLPAVRGENHPSTADSLN